MVEMQISDVRITVLKKLQTGEVFEQYAVDGMTPTCNLLKDGAEFVSRRMQMPEGFCSWAWADVQRDITYKCSVVLCSGAFLAP